MGKMIDAQFDRRRLDRDHWYGHEG